MGPGRSGSRGENQALSSRDLADRGQESWAACSDPVWELQIRQDVVSEMNDEASLELEGVSSVAVAGWRTHRT
jgi:hypothetical protein